MRAQCFSVEALGACPLLGFFSPILVLTKGALASTVSIPWVLFYRESDKCVDVNHTSYPMGKKMNMNVTPNMNNCGLGTWARVAPNYMF